MPHGCHVCNCQVTAGRYCPGHCFNGECDKVGFNITEGMFWSNDFFAPLIFVVGEEKNFPGGADGFANAVLDAPLTVTNTSLNGAVPSPSCSSGARGRTSSSPTTGPRSPTA